MLLALWVVTLASLRQIRRRTVPVEQLLDATEHLKANDFSYRVRIASRDEFAALGAAFNDMAESIEGHEAAMSAFNRISVSLSVEKDEAQLVHTVLGGAQEILNADAAALFVVSKDGRLELSLARVASLGLSQPGPGGDDGAPPMPAVEGATERTISTADVHGGSAVEFGPLLDFDRRTGYRSQSFLSVPLREHDNEAIGVLQVINARARGTGEIIEFSDDDRRLLESLASSAAVALTKNRLVQDYKGLFEGLTELISTAIDEQSPHTGGHVRRVVILSTMIAEAMSRSRNATLRNRALSADELYELRIAALLHDCGKLTTPVHLTAKATKLESIVDRFRLIEERAEIARRDHRLGLFAEALRELAPEEDARERLARLDAAGERFDRQLEEDLAVLRLCNEGSDHLPDKMIDAVQSIAAAYSWRDIRGERRSLVTDDERYHLSTRAGTLTREERAVVQGHVVSTTRMLERLPYPKWLRNVPRYAGVHHEQVGGKGYPCGLAGEAIPIQGRIIGIADVLEALTARDRPYRRAMTLPEAVERLAFLARTGAVDPDLYELIMAEGIHLRYAEEYLPRS